MPELEQLRAFRLVVHPVRVCDDETRRRAQIQRAGKVAASAVPEPFVGRRAVLDQTRQLITERLFPLVVNGKVKTGKQCLIPFRHVAERGAQLVLTTGILGAREELLGLQVKKPERTGYYVQIASFENEINARRFVAARRAEGIGAVEIFHSVHEGISVFPVRIGPFETEENARAARENLAGQGVEGNVVHIAPEGGGGEGDG